MLLGDIAMLLGDDANDPTLCGNIYSDLLCCDCFMSGWFLVQIFFCLAVA